MDHQSAIRTQAAERYLLEEMSEAERHEFEGHFFDCPDCASDVRQGAAMADAIRTGGGPAAVLPFATPAARPPRPLSQWLSIAAAGVLALVAAYQAFVVIPDLRHGAGAQALAPTVLRPISRGDLPVVTRPAADALVSFAMDVNLEPAPAALSYSLRAVGGDRDVVRGDAPMPAPGTPLLLVLPGRSLTPGRYELRVAPAGGLTPEAGASLYRFEVR